jgi:site-specific DNA recombinase
MTSRIRCAIYTRKSSEEGLEQSFNSLHAQREACEAYISSQRHEGWHVVNTAYDDGGFSGGTMQRPALGKLLDDIAAKKIDTVVVYKVDRLTRSLADFAKIVEQFDQQGISFVSVTQQFNTTTSMGRLTLNVLLSFAQFEREVTGERIRDKIAASKRKGIWMGGVVPVGYELRNRQLIINSLEAIRVREIYQLYLELGCVSKLQAHLETSGIRSKERVSQNGRASGGAIYSRGALYDMLKNRIYLGEITHKGASYPGQHDAIVEQEIWHQVQARLQANLQAVRRGPRVTAQSLLTGLLHDEEGNRFTPSHAAKAGKRYRYYVSQAVIKNKARKPHGPVRLPAQEIEDLIVSQLQSFLQSPQRLMDGLADASDGSADIQKIVGKTKEWASASPNRIQSVLQLIVKRIVVKEKQVELKLSRQALREMVNGLNGAAMIPNANRPVDDVVSLVIRAQLKRCGGEVRLVLPPDIGPNKPHTVPALIRAVALAHDWVDQIRSGQVANQGALAAQTGLNKRYISRLIPLAFLAPDLTEAILEGRQPAQMTLASCLKSLHADWSQQREHWRF